MMTVSIETVRPGMVLAGSVVNEAGMTLFGRGTVITDVVIERMRSAGAALVMIEGRPTPRKPRDEELSALDARFRMVHEAPHMAGIREMVRRHIESSYGAE